MSKPMEVNWLVEEKDYTTGMVTFSQEYSDYNEAMNTYGNLKRTNVLNTVILQKKEKYLLQE